MKKIKSKGDRISPEEAWKNRFERMMTALLFLTVLMGVFLGFSFKAITSIPEPKYYAAREDGTSLSIVAIREPFLRERQIMNFVREAASRALTLKFSALDDDLAEIRDYFTPDGWVAYRNSLTPTLETAVKSRINITTIASNPVITRTGPNDNGDHSWIVQVPLSITYESASAVRTENKIAQIEVVKVPVSIQSRGISMRKVVIQ